MNAIIDATSEQTMSSREIADLCEKQHAHVMRDIRDMLAQLHGEGGASKFGSSYLTAQNKAAPEHLLPKRETLILVSGYNLAVRAKIIDRWQELEVRERPDPMVALNDPATMRGLLLSYSEKVMQLESVNAELAPKAEALDRIAGSEGSFCLTDAAKAFGMRPIDFNRELHAREWIYRRVGSGRWIGRSEKERQGLVTHKLTTGRKPDGTEWSDEQVRITPKGMTKLALLFGGPLANAA